MLSNGRGKFPLFPWEKLVGELPPIIMLMPEVARQLDARCLANEGGEAAALDLV
jgi:hypothetical protein